MLVCSSLGAAVVAGTGDYDEELAVIVNNLNEKTGREVNYRGDLPEDYTRLVNLVYESDDERMKVDRVYRHMRLS
jgi:hypothetical protein